MNYQPIEFTFNTSIDEIGVIQLNGTIGGNYGDIREVTVNYDNGIVIGKGVLVYSDIYNTHTSQQQKEDIIVNLTNEIINECWQSWYNQYIEIGVILL